MKLAHTTQRNWAGRVMVFKAKILNSHNFHNWRHMHFRSSLPFRLNTSHDRSMSVSRFYNRIGRVCALAAILLLPVLAYADPGKPKKHPPAVPEVNTVWVLIPVVGAVMFFSARRLRRSTPLNRSPLLQP
jgi:hypothetical protein